MVYVFFAEGFEEVEALTAVDVLRRAGVCVQMVGLNDKMVMGAHGIAVGMDAQLSELSESAEAIQMLVLPGGMPGAEHLARSEALGRRFRSAEASGTVFLAAICAAPIALSAYGVIKGKAVTCYPGMGAQLENAEVIDAAVVRDGMLITGRGPGAAMDFSLELVHALKGEDTARRLAGELLVNWHPA